MNSPLNMSNWRPPIDPFIWSFIALLITIPIEIIIILLWINPEKQEIRDQVIKAVAVANFASWIIGALAYMILTLLAGYP